MGKLGNSASTVLVDKPIFKFANAYKNNTFKNDFVPITFSKALSIDIIIYRAFATSRYALLFVNLIFTPMWVLNHATTIISPFYLFFLYGIIIISHLVS